MGMILNLIIPINGQGYQEIHNEKNKNSTNAGLQGILLSGFLKIICSKQTQHEEINSELCSI